MSERIRGRRKEEIIVTGVIIRRVVKIGRIRGGSSRRSINSRNRGSLRLIVDVLIELRIEELIHRRVGRIVTVICLIGESPILFGGFRSFKATFDGGNVANRRIDTPLEVLGVRREQPFTDHLFLDAQEDLLEFDKREMLVSVGIVFLEKNIDLLGSDGLLLEDLINVFGHAAHLMAINEMVVVLVKVAKDFDDTLHLELIEADRSRIEVKPSRHLGKCSW